MRSHHIPHDWTIGTLAFIALGDTVGYSLGIVFGIMGGA